MTSHVRSSVLAAGGQDAELHGQYHAGRPRLPAAAVCGDPGPCWRRISQRPGAHSALHMVHVHIVSTLHLCILQLSETTWEAVSLSMHGCMPGDQLPCCTVCESVLHLCKCALVCTLQHVTLTSSRCRLGVTAGLLASGDCFQPIRPGNRHQRDGAVYTGATLCTLQPFAQSDSGGKAQQIPEPSAWHVSSSRLQQRQGHTVSTGMAPICLHGDGNGNQSKSIMSSSRYKLHPTYGGLPPDKAQCR